MSSSRRDSRHGAAAVAMVLILIIVDLIIVGIAIGGSRDHDLTVRRLQTIQAFYAAESGTNMAVRELMQDVDEDSDGGIGTVSADDPVDDANDPKPSNPPTGPAQVVVTAVTELPGPPVEDPLGLLEEGQTRLTSTGRSGPAQREMHTILE